MCAMELDNQMVVYPQVQIWMAPTPFAMKLESITSTAVVSSDEKELSLDYPYFAFDQNL